MMCAVVNVFGEEFPRRRKTIPWKRETTMVFSHLNEKLVT